MFQTRFSLERCLSPFEYSCREKLCIATLRVSLKKKEGITIDRLRERRREDERKTRRGSELISKRATVAETRRVTKYRTF